MYPKRGLLSSSLRDSPLAGFVLLHVTSLSPAFKHFLCHKHYLPCDSLRSLQMEKVKKRLSDLCLEYYRLTVGKVRGLDSKVRRRFLATYKALGSYQTRLFACRRSPRPSTPSPSPSPTPSTARPSPSSHYPSPSSRDPPSP